MKWLFASAGVDIKEQALRVWNMRVEPADLIVNGVLTGDGVVAETSSPELREGR